MANATTVNGFPVPLAANTGWRLLPDFNAARCDDFSVDRNGEVYYKGALVGNDTTYADAARANALVLSAAEAAAAIAAMP